MLNLLREEVGMEVVQSGPLGTSTSVFMRGAGSSSTLVLVDGVQVNSNPSGSYNFADITIDNIEKIEILRGPQSTLCGSGAVGGVINIITKRGKGKLRKEKRLQACLPGLKLWESKMDSPDTQNPEQDQRTATKAWETVKPR